MLRSGYSPSIFLLLLMIGSLSGAIVVTGCSTVPLTGRRQLLTVSEAEENQLGISAYREVLATESVSKNEHYNKLVQRVGQRIAGVRDCDSIFICG